MPFPVRQILFGFLIFLLQWLVFGRLRILGAYPDLVLLFVAWMGIRYGRLSGTIAGFSLGFLMDAVYGLWGIHMFVKTLVGFLVGLFPASERETLLIQPQQALIGALVIALVHNGLFVTLLALDTGARTTFLVTALWLGSAAYTAFVGMLVSLFAVR